MGPGDEPEGGFVHPVARPAAFTPATSVQRPLGSTFAEDHPMPGFHSVRRLFIAVLLTLGGPSAGAQEGEGEHREVTLHPLAGGPQGPPAGTDGPRSSAIRGMESVLKEKSGVFAYNAAAYGATLRREGVEVVIPKALPGVGEPRLSYRFLGAATWEPAPEPATRVTVRRAARGARPRVSPRGR